MAEDLSSLVRAGNKKEFDEWGKFIEYSEEQKRTRGHEKSGQSQIWVDDDLKSKLEKMKALGLKYPVRYMVNSIIRVFLDANSQEVSKFLPK